MFGSLAGRMSSSRWSRIWRGDGRLLNPEMQRVSLNLSQGPATIAPNIMEPVIAVGSPWALFSPAVSSWTAMQSQPDRIPRLFNPGMRVLAGLSSMDGANQWDHNRWLPPVPIPQRGGTVRAVSGGSNRQRMTAALVHIPAVLVPLRGQR